MQLGSGTFDFTGAASYSRIINKVSIGANTNATLRTGKNKNDYKLGNNIGAAGWVQPELVFQESLVSPFIKT